MAKAEPFSTKSLAQEPVTRLKGVGEQLARKLAKLGINTLQDAVCHLPFRYQDRTRITPIGSLQPQTEAVIEGTILGCDLVYGKRRSLLCLLGDDSGRIGLRFYHFSAAQKQRLEPGTRLRCFGETRRGAAGLEIYHPEYVFAETTPADLQQTLTPIYPATEGITQPRLRGLIQQALQWASPDNLPELLSDSVRQRFQQVDLLTALQFLHSPPANALHSLQEGRHPIQRRLAIEELLAHHLSLLRVRKQLKAETGIALTGDAALVRDFIQALPFALTGAQQRVQQEIAADLAQAHPMLRLVQGDVGSGKTVIAALAALQAVSQGYQVALMAPTEILAEQHRQNFLHWLQPLGITVAWLTGRQKAAEKREQLAAIETGVAQVVIGTHALIQTEVSFHRLALVIIDEQHRFGVHQRLTLRSKGGENESLIPHQLVMTATPIPRTLAMSVYADLDVSVIDELPPGRTPVETVLISDQRRDQVVARVHHACGQGRQAYWVCTLVEESEVLEAQAAEATANNLRRALPGLSIGLVHGRLKSREKEQVMSAFKRGGIQLLVATTVIEVGVDVPNASLMIIENPERLGLAQLHQLRGRVGRGRADSHCVLLYGSPLGKTAKARLQTMRQSNDGFVIAEKDLDIRGPGEVLGTRQTGEMELKIADLQRDADLLPLVRSAAELVTPDGADALIERWLGNKSVFASV